MRVGAFDDFTVHLQDKPHDAVRRRVLRSEIHHEVLNSRRALQLAFDGRALFAHGVPPVAGLPSPAFSSPGRILSIPSHGDRKSKLRNSCCKWTGSYTTRFCSSS